LKIELSSSESAGVCWWKGLRDKPENDKMVG